MTRDVRAWDTEMEIADLDNQAPEASQPYTNIIAIIETEPNEVNRMRVVLLA